MIERNTTVPMYRTSLPCVPAGPFKGTVVVSMRPLSPADAIRAIQITSRFPAVHGAPLHFGAPEAIGIAEQCGVHVEIVHFKCSGTDNWGGAAKLLKMLADARAAVGLPVLRKDFTIAYQG